MSKLENLQKSYEQAQRKLEAIQANNQALFLKKRNIERQIDANQRKIQKLTFFLEKTERAIEDKNTSRPQTVQLGKMQLFE